MSIDFLMALMAGVPPVTGPQPVVSGVTTSDAGSIGCNGTTVVNDTVVVSWSVTNPDNTLYYINVLRNGVVRNASHLSSTTTSYNDTVPGSLNATRTPTSVSYTYTVQIRKISDNSSVSSASASALALTLYTACGGQV